MPSKPSTTPVSAAQHLARSLRTRLGDAETRRVLDKAGLNGMLAAPPDARIPQASEAQLATAVCDAAGDIDFALRTGLTYETVDTVAGYIGRHSRTLGDALSDSRRYTILSRPGLRYSFEASGNSAPIRIDCVDPVLAAEPRYLEFAVGALLALTRHFTGHPVNPIAVSFRHQRRDAARDVIRAIGTEIRFGGEDIEIMFPLSALELPLRDYDENLRQLLLSQAETLRALITRSDAGLAKQTEMAILESFPDSAPDVKRIARTLGLSPRSLARKLREAGTSFSELLVKTRTRLARQYLTETDLPAGEVAYLLGYASPSAFTTAFRRETGHTPMSLRKQAQHPAA